MKYSLWYKLYEEEVEDYTASDADTLLRQDLEFTPVADFEEYYSAKADLIDLECDTKYKYLQLVLKDQDTSEVVLNKMVELYTHQYKYNFVLEQNNTTSLLCVRTFYHDEYAPFHYFIDKVEFDNIPTNIQHVDFVLTDSDESVSNEDGLISTMGNVLVHAENVSVNTYGEFINSDTDNTLKRFYIDDGLLSDDMSYTLYVYHREQQEVYVKEGYTPTLIHVGDNPIWKKICYRDGSLEIYTDEQIIEDPVNAQDVKWYFNLSTGTHGIGASGGIQYPIPENEVTDFHFEEVVSVDAEDEKYTAMHLSSDNPYIKFPSKYYQSNLADYGFGANVFPNDIFGDIDFSKLHYNENTGEVSVDSEGNYIDKWGDSLTEGVYTFRTLFFKFYVSSNAARAANQRITLFEAYSEETNKRMSLSVDIDVSSLHIETFYGNTELVNLDFPIQVNEEDYLEYDKWYTAVLVIQHGIIKLIGVSSLSSYAPNANTSLGGYWQSVSVDCLDIIDPTLDKDTYINNNSYVAIGSTVNDIQNYDLYICKFGLHIAYLDHDISISNMTEFLPPDVIKELAEGYKAAPVVKFIYNDDEVVLDGSYFKELKDKKVWVNLPANLPLGNCKVQVISGDSIRHEANYLVKTVKPDDSTIDFEIDFSDNFDSAVNTFKDIFYIRQEKRAGDLSGGENGNLIYFNRGDQCAVFENHGDFYDGAICCNEKNSGDRWYGGVAPQLTFQLNEDNTVKWYSDKHVPNPYKPRTQRVGSLIQSKNYYGYGEFEIEMKVPRNFKGEAICWWMFHYQELYYPLDKDRYEFYAGGMEAENGDDNPCHEYSIGNKKGIWNYRHSFKMDSGLPFIIVNNEIDMELGSEINQINTDKNPNNDPSTIFYVPLLDPRTVIGCTTEGPNYGLWLLDYEASLPAINSKISSINSIEEDYIDRENGDYLGIKASELTWVHVSDNINDRICYDASTRALRWNNWWTEPDVGGILYKTNYTNSVRAAKGFDNFADGTSGWDIGNTVAATTPRTPLGSINLEAENINDRYIPHEMDDGKWHTWKFIWKRDYTACYIDDILIRKNATCSPFIPMPFLIGGWFPSGNSWDSGYASEGYFGTWAGVKAPWDIRHFYIKKIKYTHYTEEESPRDQMLYHAESYPYSGLREIITNEYVTITLNNVPSGAVITCDSPTSTIEGNIITAKKGDICTLTVTGTHFSTWNYYTTFDVDKQIDVAVEWNNYTINLVVNPSAASIYEGEELVEGTSFTRPYNTYLNVTLKYSGYYDATVTLVFNGNKTMEVSMEEILPTGYLYFNSPKSLTYVIPANGYTDNVISEVTDDTGNVGLLVNKDESLGTAYIFRRNYNPITFVLPNVTESNNPLYVTVPFAEQETGYGKKVIFNRSLVDNDLVTPKLELNWGSGYVEIPMGFDEFYMNYGTTWSYRVSYDEYITQEGEITPEDSDPNTNVNVSVVLQKATLSTVTVNLTPSTAQCIVSADDFETLILEGSTVIELTKGNTYTFTVSSEGYETSTVNRLITEDTEIVTVVLEEAEVEDSDINLYDQDYGIAASKVIDILDSNAGDDIVTWLFMTDNHDNATNADSNHIATTESRAAILSDLYELASDLNCSCILHGGDAVGHDSSNDTISNIEEVLESNVDTSHNIPVLYTTGNHDSQGRGAAFATQIDPSVVYNKCVLPFANLLSYTDTEYYSTNSYYDDDEHKVRFISIDSYFDKNHQHWEGTNINRTKQLAQAALNSAPSDYKIIMFSHEIVGPNWYGSNSGNQLKMLNNSNKTYFSYDKYSDLYDTLKANCPNFSNVVMFLHGHHHNSNQSVSNDNKLFISTEPGAIDVRDVYNNRNKNYDNYSDVPRSSNTNYSSCYACDFFIYNKTKQTLDVIRFGKGGDRHLDLNKQVGNTTKISMAQGYFSANLVSSTVTDFSNYYILISTNPELNTGYLDNYKFSTVLKVQSDGSVNTYSANGTNGTVINIPINCDYTVQLCKYEGYKYIGQKMIGTYNWNKDNYYNVILGNLNIDNL